jgi:hypothetical protein
MLGTSLLQVCISMITLVCTPQDAPFATPEPGVERAGLCEMQFIWLQMPGHDGSAETVAMQTHTAYPERLSALQSTCWMSWPLMHSRACLRSASWWNSA